MMNGPCTSGTLAPALPGSVHNPPTHNRRHDFPRKLRSTKRRILRARVRLGGVKRPAFLRIEDRDIGMAAANQRPASSQAEHPRRAGSEEFDNPVEWDLVSAMKVSDGETKSGFKAGDSESGALELNDLFVRRVGCVIGGNRIHGAVGQRH